MATNYYAKLVYAKEKEILLWYSPPNVLRDMIIHLAIAIWEEENFGK